MQQTSKRITRIAAAALALSCFGTANAYEAFDPYRDTTQPTVARPAVPSIAATHAHAALPAHATPAQRSAAAHAAAVHRRIRSADSHDDHVGGEH